MRNLGLFSVQNSPITKAVYTKISKTNLHTWQFFDISKQIKFKIKQLFFNQDDYWRILEFQYQTVKFALLSLTITVIAQN